MSLNPHSERAAQFRELFERGFTPQEVAERLGVKDDYAGHVRALLFGSSRKAERRVDRLTEEQRDWARRCLDEGVVATFVAETLDVNPSSLCRWFRRETGHDALPAGAQWPKVWPTIRKNDTLRGLHNEFAPKGRGR